MVGVWGGEDPGLCATDDVFAWARRWVELSGVVTEQIERPLVRVEGWASDGSWRSLVASGVAARIGELRPVVAAIASGYAAGAAALGQYGVVVAQIGQEARVLRHREREARQIMVAARQALELASAGLDEAVRCSAQQRVDAAEEQLRRVGVAWRQLSERREAADTTCVRLLTAPAVLGAFSNLLTTTNTNTSTGAGVGVRTGTGAGTLAGTLAGTGAGVLVSVGRMSAFDHLVLQRVRPDLLTDLARCPPLPGEVARAWSVLTPQQRAVLVSRYPATVGQLNGLPPADRVAANRLLATRRLAEAQTELAQLQARLGALPTLLNKYSPTVSQPQRVALNASIADLSQEITYLSQVQDGVIQLYLYDRGADRIIEMIGDPARAKVVLSYLPGSDSTLAGMYQGALNNRRRGGIQALAQWEVGRSYGEVVAFVFKDGRFPQTADLFSHGPQINTIADTIGANYADFLKGLRASDLGELRIVSVEHSFGSAAAGEAERRGAQLDTRILLGGIGMKAGWQPDPSTTYIGYAGRYDLNKLFYTPTGQGLAMGDLGYAVAPTTENGIIERDSGINFSGNELAKILWGMTVPPIAMKLQIEDMLTQHNQIAGVEGNDKVLREILDELVRDAN